MYRYVQRTGALYDGDEQIATGYSGFGPHRNLPESEALPGLGPIPAGLYDIGDEVDSRVRGPVVLPLKPVSHDAHGRSAFLIHGDSREHPGMASHGCIILPRVIRERIADGAQRKLLVLHEEPAKAVA